MDQEMIIWRDIVRDSVSEIADEDEQVRTWRQQVNAWDTPGEIFNRFFSDATFREFLERPDNGLDSDQKHAAEDLLRLMERALEKTPEFVSPNDLIGKDFWKDCIEAARKLKSIWK